MPNRTPKKPAYGLHKPTGQARVRINGKDHYLGTHGSPESLDKYDELIRAWMLKGDVNAFNLTVDELALRWLDHARGYYVKDGKPTRLTTIHMAIKWLVKVAGKCKVREYGPLKHKEVREAMIAHGYARTTVNASCDEIKRCFRHGVENEWCPVEVWQALRSVRGLIKGKSAARETKPVQPVSQEHVNATLPHLPRQVRDMVRMQLLMGCRPTEVCIMRPCDIDRSGDIWLYRPESHKTEHHGHDRTIFVGPRGQEILAPWLENRPADAYCFVPSEAMAERRAAQRAARKTPVQPSQVNRSKPFPGRKPGPRYDKNSYGRAVKRACVAAGIAPWSPNRLRHSRATTIRKTYGLEAAQVMLGHATADVTQVYAERDVEKGKQIAAEIG